MSEAAEAVELPDGELPEGEAPDQSAMLSDNKRAAATFMDELFGRLPKGMDALSGKATQLIKPREVTFLFDGSAGAPDIFMDEDGNYLDVKLTIRSLSSAEEIEALGTIGGNALAAPLALAKRALYAVEDKAIRPEQRELIWEALGSMGRQLVLLAFQNLGGASDAAMGKYRSSFTVS